MTAVRQIAVPAEARALSTLARIDYADAFLVDVGSPADRTAEGWARAILEDAPRSMRGGLLSGWSMLGLKVGGAQSGEFVLGWRIRSSTPDFVLLAAESRIGMPGQLLFKRHNNALLFDTFVQHGNPVARAVWASVEATHVRIVRDLLDDAGRRFAR
jgi:hypothetical protein